MKSDIAKAQAAKGRKELRTWYVRKLLMASGWPKEGLNLYPEITELHRVLVRMKRAIAKRNKGIS